MVFIFSVIYILYCFYLSCSTSYLGVVGGWAGAARFGRTSYFFIFDSFFNFFTLWRPLFLTSLCLQVFIRGKASMVPLFEPFLTQFLIFKLFQLCAVTGCVASGSRSWFSGHQSKVLMLYSFFNIFYLL